MALNPVSVNRAIKECREEFKNYFQLARKQFKNTIAYLKASEHNQQLYDIIKQQEKESNLLYDEIYDLVTWHLSKEVPNAMFLKPFLAVISSIKDVERICDTNYNVAKIFKKTLKQYDKKFSKSLISLYGLCYDSLREMWHHFLENPEKISKSSFKACKKVQLSFHDEYLKIIHQSTHEYFVYAISKIYKQQEQDKKIQNAEELLVNLTVVAKQIERIIDHGLNIIENFYLIHYVNEENFLIDKEK